MNVLVLDNSTTWRGGQEQIFTLIRGLQQHGVKVELLSPRSAPLADRVARLGIRHLHASWRSEVAAGLVPALREALSRTRWDVLHFNTPCGIAMASLLGRLSGVPVRVASRRVNFPLQGVLSRWKYLYSADCLITVSREIAETLRVAGIPAGRLEVVYEGVDVGEVDRSETRREFPEDCVVIGCIAFLSAEKGHATLLRAFALLHSERSHARLVLVGEGEERSSLERQAQDLGIRESVHFAGFQEDVCPFLRGFDIFALPSLSEGLSSGILGAMAASLPVVASEVGGIPELVQRDVTGMLVPPQEPEALALALRELVDRPALRSQFGQAGRARVSQDFTLEQKVERTLQIYQALLRRKQA